MECWRSFCLRIVIRFHMRWSYGRDLFFIVYLEFSERVFAVGIVSIILFKYLRNAVRKIGLIKCLWQ